MAIDLPAVNGHPNRAAFRGVLTFVETPSDKAPSGAQGHRVLLTRAATEQALPSLLGMALDYAPTLDRHDARRKVGVITQAEIVPGPLLSAGGSMQRAHAGSLCVPDSSRNRGRRIRAGEANKAGAQESARGNPTATVPRIEVAGYLFARDFPELVREMRASGPNRLGMSYEIADARIRDLRASIWTVTDFMFTGAAVLRRDKAAYQNTWIELT
jgi:hypothetical protein